MVELLYDFVELRGRIEQNAIPQFSVLVLDQLFLLQIDVSVADKSLFFAILQLLFDSLNVSGHLFLFQVVSSEGVQLELILQIVHNLADEQSFLPYVSSALFGYPAELTIRKEVIEQTQ